MGLSSVASHAIWVTAILVGGGALTATLLREAEETRVASEALDDRLDARLGDGVRFLGAALSLTGGILSDNEVRITLQNTGRTMLDPREMSFVFDGVWRAVSAWEAGGDADSRVWAPGEYANITVTAPFAPHRVVMTGDGGASFTWLNTEPSYYLTLEVLPSEATVELLDSQAFTATGLDQYGEQVPTTGTLTWTTDVPGGTIAADGTLTAGDTVGTGRVTARDGDVSGFSTVTTFRNPPVLNGLVVTPDPASVEFQAVQDFEAQGYDQYGIAMASTPVWTTDLTDVTLVPLTGAFTAGTTAGTGTVTATEGAVSDAASVTVYRNAAVLTSMTVSPETALVEFLDAQQFTVQGYDQYGLPMAASPTWTTDVAGATVSAAGLFTAGTTAGTGLVTATQGAVSATADVTVFRDPAVLTSVSVAPDPASVEFLDTQAFTATGYDQYALPMAATFAWTTDVAGATVGPLDGVFVAGTTADSGVVTATSGLVSGSAAVEVFRDAAILTSLEVTPATATVQATKSTIFAAQGYDQYGLPMASSPTWTTGVSGASVSGAGLFTAGTTLTTGTVTATQGAVSDAASVTVSSLEVYVDSIRHYKGAAEQYSFNAAVDTVTTKVVVRAVVDDAVVQGASVTMVTQDTLLATRNTASGATDASGVATTSYGLPNLPLGAWRVQVTDVTGASMTYVPLENTAPYDVAAERAYTVT